MHALVTLTSAAALTAFAGLVGLFWYARFLGWAGLVKRYAIRGTAPVGRYRVDTVLLGEASWYGPPMFVDVGPQGIDPTPSFPYRIAFRPVRIPGVDVSAERKKNTSSSSCGCRWAGGRRSWSVSRPPRRCTRSKSG
ncbi:MAG: hypothetical protein ACLPYS_17670 [Vulcanimicrobiaceae bacterium]|jgi:hypothetical protein